MAENNALVSGILWEQLKLDIMVPQISKEAPKASEVLPVLLPVKIPDTQNNTEDRSNMESTMELKRYLVQPKTSTFSTRALIWLH